MSMLSSHVPPGLRLLGEGVVDGLPDAPHLVGSACRSCHAVTFPAQGSCNRCTATDVERHPLATTGTLWGFTVQGFPPKEPYVQARAPFTPFGVGYVDLGGEVLVEARLVARDPERLRVGQPMVLVLEPLTVDGTGEVVLTYAFTPAEAEGRPKGDTP
jgi:uncharacterized OB-fold protein